MANKVVGHVRCELGRAILEKIDFDIREAGGQVSKRKYPWLDTWVGTLTLTMQVDEKTAVNPGLTYTNPLPLSQTFSLGAGATGSADATRKEQIDYVFDIEKDFVKDKKFLKYNDTTVANKGPCEDNSVLIEGDLRIADWLDDVLFPYSVGTADARAPDVLTDDITFVVSYSGNITPSWKLVRVAVNPGGTFLSTTRTRTNEALIALGPPKAGGKTPSQTVLDFRNIALFGSSVNVSLKTP